MTYAVIILLGLMTYFDIRDREIPVIHIILGACITVPYMIYQVVCGREIGDVMFCILPGLVLTVLHYISPEHMGLGDGLVLVITEFSIPLRYCLQALFLTGVLCGVTGLILILIRRKEDTIPFVPFIAIGYLTTIVKGMLIN